MDIPVYRDGELDPEYKRKQAIKHTKKAVAAVLRPIMDKLQDKVEEWRVEGEIESYDKRHGTNLLAEYKTKQHQKALLAGRQMFLA